MTAPFSARIAIVGTPSQPHRAWSPKTLEALRNDGYTGVQLNIAWSYRPDDEPLNLEDVLVVEGAPDSNASPTRSADQRLATLRERAKLARELGLRTIFHVGLPFQGRAGFDGLPLPQCISDPAVLNRYVTALERLAQRVPDLDDLLIYTYDQDAWLCSEFGTCPRCAGVPLDRRLPQFINGLALAWASARPVGARLYWEPWELSAGQALACMRRLDAGVVGVMVHSNIGEVITVDAGDVFVKNAAGLAAERGMPFVVEAFLSSSNEEVEPWTHLPVPVCTVEQLRTLGGIYGVTGVKEYFGLQDDPLDVNAAAAVTLLQNPNASNETVLESVACRFGLLWLPRFWSQTSQAYKLYPWDLSWFARQLGNSHPVHSLDAAILRGTQTAASEWDTPAWRSSRHGVFVRSTADAPHPWELEDARLRFALAARAMQRALDVFDEAFAPDGTFSSDHLQLQRLDAERFVTRCTAYECHISETLHAQQVRDALSADQRMRHLGELRKELYRDLVNQKRELALPPAHLLEADRDLRVAERWIAPAATSTEDIEIAIRLLERDSDAFLDTYLLPGPPAARHGQFSLTSP